MCDCVWLGFRCENLSMTWSWTQTSTPTIITSGSTLKSATWLLASTTASTSSTVKNSTVSLTLVSINFTCFTLLPNGNFYLNFFFFKEVMGRCFCVGSHIAVVAFLAADLWCVVCGWLLTCWVDSSQKRKPCIFVDQLDYKIYLSLKKYLQCMNTLWLVPWVSLHHRYHCNAFLDSYWDASDRLPCLDRQWFQPMMCRLCWFSNGFQGHHAGRFILIWS